MCVCVGKKETPLVCPPPRVRFQYRCNSDTYITYTTLHTLPRWFTPRGLRWAKEKGGKRSRGINYTILHDVLEKKRALAAPPLPPRGRGGPSSDFSLNKGKFDPRHYKTPAAVHDDNHQTKYLPVDVVIVMLLLQRGHYRSGASLIA